MADTAKDRLIDKIKKLLAVTSEAGATEAEAVAAALAAQRLMVAHDISERELWAEVPEVIEEISVGSVRMDWKKSLLSVVARSYRCSCYLNGGGKTFQGIFVGRSSDASAAKLVFDSLANLGQKLSKKAGEARKQQAAQAQANLYVHESLKEDYVKRWLNQEAAKARTSFLAGFVSGVASVLDKQTRELLVLVPSEVADYMDNMNLTSHKQRKKSYSCDAYEQGRLEGAAAVASGRVEDGQNPCLVA